MQKKEKYASRIGLFSVVKKPNLVEKFKEFVPAVSHRIILVFFGTMLASSIALFLTLRVLPKNSVPTPQSSQPEVLATTTKAIRGFFSVNVPAHFNDSVILKTGIEAGSGTFTGDVTVEGTLTASNLLAGLTAGTGITVTAGQRPTITNSGVVSVQGQTGALSLQAGSNITIDGLKISSSVSTPNTFKTITVGSDSFSAGSSTDTLEFAAGSGITVTSDTTNKKLTFSASGGTSAWTDGGTDVYLTTISDNVGIGTNTPSYKLDVNGIVNATALYVNGAPYVGSQWTTTGSNIYFNTGNVGIGNTSPSSTLDVTGTFSVTGNSAFGSNLSVTGAATISSVLNVLGLATFNAGATIPTGQNLTLSGNLASNLVPSLDLTYNLGSPSLRFDTIYASSIIGGSSGTLGHWQKDLGVISPANPLDDFAIGGSSTASALFQVIGSGANAGNVNITGSTTLGDNAASDLVTFNSRVASNLEPSTGSQYDLGSSARRWLNVYGDTANFLNLSVSNATISGTTLADFLINSDNVTDDTEVSTLTFERGAPATNAQLKWNATGTPSKVFSLNAPLSISQDAGIYNSGTAAFMVNQTQSQDILSASASGVTKLILNNSGYLGLGTSPSYPLDVISTQANQLRIGYDTSNYFLSAVSATGAITFDAVGSGAGFTFNDGVSLGIAGTSNGSLTFNSSGVGETAPTITSNATGDLTLSAPTGTLYLGTGTSGDVTIDPDAGNFLVNLSSTGDFIVQDNGTNFAVFSNLGRFGLGSGMASPSSLMEVSGTVTGKALAVFNETGGNTILTASESGTTRLVLTNAGLLGLGTTTPLGFLDVRGNGTTPIASVSGATSFAGLVVNNNSTTGDLLTASSSGLTRFTIANNGNITAGGSLTGLTGLTSSGTITLSGFSSNGGVLYTNGSGVLSQATAGTASQCLFGGTTPSFGACPGGGIWEILNGAIVPQVVTNDLLIGGNSTASALLRIAGNTGLAGTGPVASIAANTSFAALAVNNNSIRGDLFTASSSGLNRFVIKNNGNVGIGTALPTATLDIRGSASLSGGLTFDGAATIGTTKNNTLTIGGAQSGMLILKSSNVIVFQNPGTSNTFVGESAGSVNTTGTNNAFFGVNAGLNNDGSSNSFFGDNAGRTNSSGALNSLFGRNSGYAINSGSSNSFFGYETGRYTTSGSRNTFIGQQAGYGNTFGGENAFLGYFAGNTNTQGIGNVFLGYKAGETPWAAYANTTGNYNTFIGYESGPGSATQLTNATAIGYQAFVNANNAIVLGGTGAKAVRVGIGTATPSALLDLRGLGTTSIASVSGTTSFAALVANNNSTTGDLFTASASGATRMVLSNNGFLGLGTRMPAYPLDLISTQLKQARLGYDTSNYFTTSISSTGAATFDAVGSGASFVFNDAVTLGIGGTSNGTLYFATTGAGEATPSISANATGDLVLSAPTGTITLGSANLSGDINIDPGASNLVANLSGVGDFLIQDNGTTFATFTDTGTFGFGTTSPLAAFDIRNNGTTAVASVSGTTSFAGLVVNNNSTTGDLFTASASGLTRFVIRNNGNVDIRGTASLSGNLLFDTAGIIQTTKNQDLTIGGDTTGTLTLKDHNNTVFRVYETNTMLGVSAGNAVGGSTSLGTFVGYQAGLNNTGSYNSFFGHQTGLQNITGTENAYFGEWAGRDSTGSFNSFFGRIAGWKATGDDNTLMGAYAGLGLTTGGDNTFIGYFSGISNTIGTYNVLIGSNANVGSNNLTNAIAIGATSVVSASNSLILGGTGAYAVQVGIGTTTPLAGLDVRGPSNTNPVASFSGSTTFAGLLVDNSLGDLFTASSSGITRMVLKNNGNFGVGTATPSSRLQVGNQGDGTVAVANAWNNFSDLRFKDNVKTITDGLSKILALNGVSFNWKNSGLPSIGFIAQDVEKIVPEIVNTDSNGFKSLDYGKIAPLLVNAVHEEQSQIETLKSQNIDLTAKIADLSDKVSKLPNINLLAYTASNSSDFVTINDSLLVLGSATFNQASVADTLNVGNTLSITGNSINTIGTNLELQPLKQGEVSFMGGIAKIDTNGNFTTQGNITAQNISAKGVLSAKSFSVIKDTITDLSSTESESSASAGISYIKAGQTFRKINNPGIKTDSIISITPEDASGTLYIADKKEGEYFIVAMKNEELKDIRFNYLIVNQE